MISLFPDRSSGVQLVHLEISFMGIKTPVSLLAIITVMRQVSGLISLRTSLAVMEPVSLETGKNSTSLKGKVSFTKTSHLDMCNRKPASCSASSFFNGRSIASCSTFVVIKWGFCLVVVSPELFNQSEKYFIVVQSTVWLV